MEIRQKITYQFIIIVAILIFASNLVVYFLFSSQRHENFKDRLISKTKSIAQLIAETDKRESELVNSIERNNPTSLPKEKMIVYNSDNEVILTSGLMNDFEISSSVIQLIRKEKELSFKKPPYEAYGLYYQGKKANVVVVCAAVDIFGIQKLKKLRIILLSVFLINLLIVYYLGRIFASNALKPISDVIHQVNEIDVVNMNTRVKTVKSKDEIALLVVTFNNLLDRIESAFKIQREFIANSSHELRTPLTAITGQLEVALLQERDIEEYKSTMTSVLEEIKSLNQLINRLLILSRASGNFTTDGFRMIRVDEVLWKSQSDLLKHHKKYTVNINFDASISDEHHFNINGNSQLLKTAFINLMENGCKYSSNHSIDIDLSASETNLTIIFKDDGIGISKDEIHLIFQPFYRGKNAKKNNGHGIGLSLAEKIILFHNGNIKVNSKLNSGSKFIVNLPLT